MNYESYSIRFDAGGLSPNRKPIQDELKYGALVNNSANHNYSIEDIRITERTDKFDPLKSIEYSIIFFPIFNLRTRGDSATSFQEFKSIVKNKLDKSIDLKKLYYEQLEQDIP